MKKIILTILVFGLAVAACQKDQAVPVAEPDDGIRVEWLENLPAGVVPVNDPVGLPGPGGCDYHPCDMVMQYWVKHYQAIADETCEPIYFIAACCDGPSTLYMKVMLEPDCIGKITVGHKDFTGD
jgi:hypothetical protein